MREKSSRSSSHVCGSPTSGISTQNTTSERSSHLSDPRLYGGVNAQHSPQRNNMYKSSDELSDPRRRQRDAKERSVESEEKHYTKSAKYTKISSALVSRRPAMLKASGISKVAKGKSIGPQIIEPHFVSSSPPKAKVSDKGDKSKASVKLPEATSAKKALANFKIPKHKSSKAVSESASSKPAVKIPALDTIEKCKKEHAVQEPACNNAKADVTVKKGCNPANEKTARGKEVKCNVPTKQMKVLSTLDATTLQALTTIVQQTLKMV